MDGRRTPKHTAYSSFMTDGTPPDVQRIMDTTGLEEPGAGAKVDKDANEITIDGKNYIMSDTGGGAAMMPPVGAEITLFYREEGGQNLITRIGQAQQ